ncbi:MAG TPA: DPP IV N-terminal domain-containing protein, partial [Bacteroidia bacterium]|nr:DPP IV N-terminal domain-containing protein [Bacteroidia bacterium]
MKKINFVFALFIISCCGEVAAQGETRKITNEDIFVKSTFRQELVSGMNWLNSGEHYAAFGTAKGEEGKLFRYEIKTGKKVDMIFDSEELVPTGQSKPIVFKDYAFSPDESKIVFTTEVEKIYRYSTREANYVYDLKTKKLTPLSVNGKQRLAKFSPDSKKMAFVRDNNIFMVDLESNKETQVTTDGVVNKIIN